MGDSRLEPLVLSEAERQVLDNWVKRRTTAQGLALRARIVLACADGGPNLAIAARLGVNRGTVAKWRTRFLRHRLNGLADEPRPGVPRTITDAQVEEVVVRMTAVSVSSPCAAKYRAIYGHGFPRVRPDLLPA
ncbi:transposase, partial [Streptomyces sp. NPDC088554]|uniref:helix-turn-helix domain-containing protein n=1 Tax=Streptomyces sp. NPDC088554 TaxID=3365865 RepID=UPI0038285AF7